jgi:enoyl-CoA hydratase
MHTGPDAKEKPMVEQRVTYQRDGSVAVITMDDGKVNALSPRMLSEIDAAFDQAETDQAVVVLAGRPGIFSAGFDLKVLGAGGMDAASMVRSGFELAERLLSFPMPVVIASTGHAMAMGVFLLQAGDYRIAAAGPYRYSANEVAIGMTLPRAAIEVLRQRLTPAAFHRAALLSESFTPDNAIEAGIVDRVVEPDSVVDAARSLANELTALNMRAHAASKLRAREQTLAALRAAIVADDAELRGRL